MSMREPAFVHEEKLASTTGGPFGLRDKLGDL